MATKPQALSSGRPQRVELFANGSGGVADGAEVIPPMLLELRPLGGAELIPLMLLEPRALGGAELAKSYVATLGKSTAAGEGSSRNLGA